MLLLKEAGYHIDERRVQRLLPVELTGLMDAGSFIGVPALDMYTGHNGRHYLHCRTTETAKLYRQLHIIIGMVNDKDISGVLALLPKDAV